MTTAETASVVFIIDDDASVCKSLSRLLRSAGIGVETFLSAADFLKRSPRAGTACILLDVSMPALSGLDLQARLIDSGNDIPIVFLTGHGDIPMSVRAMKDGAVDFLTKPVDDETLLEAVQAALSQHRAILERRQEHDLIQARIDALTPRESQVLRYVVSGVLNKQIAARLGIAEKTVKVHRGRVMEKMQASSVAELVHLCDLVGLHLE